MFEHFSAESWLTLGLNVGAVLISPLITLQVRQWIEDRQAVYTRKLQIFKTLMATRGARLSIDHVTALNMIDVEFSKDKKAFAIIDAWDNYRDFLCQDLQTLSENDQMILRNKKNEAFDNLLITMAQYFKYSFRQSSIRNGAYLPNAHYEEYAEQKTLRQSLINLLQSGFLPVVDVSPELQVIDKPEDNPKSYATNPISPSLSHQTNLVQEGVTPFV